jgi:hypothetical protein
MEEQPRHPTAREPPEQLGNRAAGGEDAPVGKDEMHRGIHGGVGEIGQVGAVRALAGGKQLDAIVPVPATDASDPRATEGTLTVVQQDRTR